MVASPRFAEKQLGRGPDFHRPHPNKLNSVVYNFSLEIINKTQDTPAPFHVAFRIHILHSSKTFCRNIYFPPMSSWHSLESSVTLIWQHWQQRQSGEPATETLGRNFAGGFFIRVEKLSQEFARELFLEWFLMQKLKTQDSTQQLRILAVVF